MEAKDAAGVTEAKTISKKRKAEVEESANASNAADQKLSKKQKKKLLMGRGTKQEMLSFYGPNARASMELKFEEYLKNGRSRLKASDIQTLILWVLAEAVNPKWLFIKNKPLVEKVVLIVVDGLNAAFYSDHAAGFPSIPQLFNVSSSPTPLQISASQFQQSSVMEGYFLCQKTKVKGYRSHDEKAHPKTAAPVKTTNEDGTKLTKKQKKALAQAKKAEEDAEKKKSKTKLPPAITYILSDEELRANQYPFNEASFRQTAARTSTPSPFNASRIQDKQDDAADLPSPSSSSSSSSSESKTPAQQEDAKEGDAATEEKEEKAHIIAVDCEMCHTANGLELTRVTLVAQDRSILFDSLVKPSADIVDYNTRFSGITAEMMGEVKTTLKDVQEVFLRHVSAETILVGHSLENDLRALQVEHRRIIDTALLFPHPKGLPFKSALRHLTKTYLQRTIQEGEKGHDSVEDALATLDLALLKIAKGPPFGVTPTESENLTLILSRYRKAQHLIMSPDYIKRFATPTVNCIPVSSDTEAANKAAKEVTKENDFVVVYFNSLMPMIEQSDSPTTEALRTVDEHIRKVVEACPTNSIIVLASGQSSFASLKRMHARKVKHLQAPQTPPEWTEEDEKTLKKAQTDTQIGAAWFCVKEPSE